MSEVAIEIKNVTVRRNGRTVLENVNLKIGRNQIFAICGPNGGGKTTLLRTIIGIVDFDGDVRIFQKTPREAVKQGLVSYLPQRSPMDYTFPATVYEVVMMGRLKKMGVLKIPRKDDRRKVMESLKLVDMIDFKTKPFSELSGGQQQRVLIARALASEAKILLLDEPITGLDIHAQQVFYRLLVELKERTDITIVMVTHDIGVMPSFVDAVACLNKQLYYHGMPGTELNIDLLKKVYGTDIGILIHDHGNP